MNAGDWRTARPGDVPPRVTDSWSRRLRHLFHRADQALRREIDAQPRIELPKKVVFDPTQKGFWRDVWMVVAFYVIGAAVLVLVFRVLGGAA